MKVSFLDVITEKIQAPRVVGLFASVIFGFYCVHRSNGLLARAPPLHPGARGGHSPAAGFRLRRAILDPVCGVLPEVREARTAKKGIENGTAKIREKEKIRDISSVSTSVWGCSFSS